MKKVLFVLVAAVLFGGFTATTVFAQAATAPVCDDDTDPATPGDQNNCNCVDPPAPPDPNNPPAALEGCIAIGPICLAGEAVPNPQGCLSLGGDGNNACLNAPDPSGLVLPCTDAECAAASSAGCGA